MGIKNPGPSNHFEQLVAKYYTLNGVVLYGILYYLMISDSIARYCFVGLGCVSQDAYMVHLKDGFPKDEFKINFAHTEHYRKPAIPYCQQIWNNYKRKQVPNVENDIVLDVFLSIM